MALTEGKPALSGRALGLVLIFLTAIIWVAASFVSQLLVTNEEGRTNFNVPPFLLTYLSTSVFTIFLPLVHIKSLLQETWLLRRSFKYKPLQEDEEAAPINTAGQHRLTDPTAAAAAAAAEDFSPTCNGTSTAAAGAGGSGGGLSGLTADLDMAEAAAAADAASAAARASRAAHKEALTAAAQCFLLWFAAQFLFNQSLSLTSVTSNTILSSTSSLFTFALSMAFLKEPYSAAKMASIAACIGGTLLVTLSDDSSSGNSGGSGSSSVRGSSLAAAIAANTTAATPSASPPTTTSSSGSGPSHSVWGDLLCLVSAAFYACYTIVLRKALPDDDEANVALFFGYVGLLCSVVFAPVVALLAGVGALHLKAIPSKAYLIILVQGILNYCLSDYLWAHAVLLLGPTIATLGLSVQIPVAAVVEALIGHPKWLSSGAAMAMTLSGTGLIMVGFVAGNLAGGGRVYGSHHRDDGAGLQGDTCSSIHGLADDSFSQRSSSSSRSPPPHSRTNGISSTHTLGPGSTTSSRSSPERARHTPHSHSHLSLNDGDDGDDDDDMPQSPLLHHTKQQQVSHFDREAGGLTVPVSTHASIRLSNAGGSSSSPRNSSPGRPLHSPRQAATAAAGFLAKGSSSPHQQQQQFRQQQQQWESIELSSSFGSEGQKSDQGSPSALLGLRPSEQLPQHRSPLGTHSSSSSNGSSSAQQGTQPPAAAGAAAGAGAAAQSPPPQLPPAAAGVGGAGVDLLSFDAATPQQQQQQQQQQEW